MKLFRFDHIAIFCNDTSTTVVPMVKYYYDKPEFNGWCFNVNERYMEGEIEASTEFRNAKRRVFYDFEHFNRSNDDYCRWFIGIMSDRRYDEWWDYNIENVGYMRAVFDVNIQFRPPRWYPIEPYASPSSPDFDFLFYGALTYDRFHWFHDIMDEVKIDGNPPRMCILDGVWDDRTIRRYIDRSNRVLVVHGYFNESIQEEMRMLPLVCGGKPVICERSPINYFEGCVTEVGREDLPDMGAGKELADISSRYRAMTEKDDAYEGYKGNIIDRYEKDRVAIMNKSNVSAIRQKDFGEFDGMFR